MSPSEKIRQEAITRGVSLLFHFTPASNIESILEYGLLSREVLAQHNAPFFPTDSWRNDGRLGAVSLSVHSINEGMFARKKWELNTEWMILAIDASILWTLPCRFCWDNAAATAIVAHTGFLGGPWAFGRMFEDQPVSRMDPGSLRQAQGRQDCQPTQNAAEVQVLSPIDPDLILGVAVRNGGVKAALEDTMGRLKRVRPVVVDGYLSQR